MGRKLLILKIEIKNKQLKIVYYLINLNAHLEVFISLS